jgi:carboxyl-terminal processing protease
MRKPWRLVAASGFLTALLIGGLAGDQMLALSDGAKDTLKVYSDLVTVAHERYGTEVQYRDLVYASIQGMLRALDPHTSFLTPQAYTGMRDRQRETFYGLGIMVGVRDGQLTVISPIEGTPASRMGIRAGDVISTIEGEPTEPMTLNDAVQKLKGPKGTEVNITIMRVGLDEPLEMAVTRAEIPQTTVRFAYMLRPGVGYLQLSEFSRGTGTEVADALARLKEQGMEQLVLDLRNNGGGLLDQAIEVSDQFVPPGTSIVETKGRLRDSFQSYRSTGEHPELGMPVVVLVNAGTASAAEILSGAIQDHDVGLIVGTPTWGKGLVQTVYSLSYGAGLALTTAKYYTPAGRLIQRDYSSFFDYYNYDPLTGQEEDAVEGEAVAPPPGEVFTTDLGREVYGGGGIAPDVLVENDEISELELFLLTRNAFFRFGIDYHNRTPVADRSWQPPEDLLAQFRAWLVEQDIATPDRLEEPFADPSTREEMELQIEAQVMNAAFGPEASQKVMARGDNQIQAALEHLDDAADLLEQRADLDRPRARELRAQLSETDRP